MAAPKKHTKTTSRKKAAAKQNYVRDSVWFLVLALLGIFLFISIVSDLTGIMGKFLRDIFLGLFGAGGFMIPLLLIYAGIQLITAKNKFASKMLFGILFILTFSAFYNVIVFTAPDYLEGSPYSLYIRDLTEKLYSDGLQNISSGGVLGGFIAVPLVHFCNKVGAGFIIFVLMAVCFIYMTGLSIDKIIDSIRERGADADAPVDKNINKELKNIKKEVSALQKQQENRKNFKIPDTGAEKPGKEMKKAGFWENFLKKDITDENGVKPETKEEFNDILIPVPTKKVPVKATAQSTAGASQAKSSEQEKAEEDPLKDVIIKKADNVLKIVDPKPTVKKEDIHEEAVNIATEIAAAGSDNIPVYKKPPVDLLKYVAPTDDENSYEELRTTATKLIEALRSFNVETKVINVSRGPTVTRYELQPNAGVKISKITNLSDDIALHLAALGVRIEAPIPGKAAIGIEIPNKTTSIVYLQELIKSSEFQKSESPISVSLGKDISGNNIVIDLAKMPHLLIAGATGSGKSVCVNSLLISLLYHSSPEDVRLLLVDPKVVELNVYNGIPHLLIPVVTDPKKAAGALSWAVSEMLKRYELFKEKGVRDFSGYNKNLVEGESKLPQIVIIIDEMADLMMTSPTEVEDAICRLAQMARAAGMHLVIATQRPSVDVITGTIKANVPSRIAFAVSSQIDSRIILDGSGAEKLVGKGDMLYNPLGANKPLRVQGCFVSDKEVENVVSFIKENGTSDYDDNVMKEIEEKALEQTKGKGKASGGGDNGNEEEDPMLQSAIEVVVEGGQASTSVLQRRLRLGYARAARIMDEMESRGIIGPYQGSKPRDVLLSKQQWYEMKNRGEE